MKKELEMDFMKSKKKWIICLFFFALAFTVSYGVGYIVGISLEGDGVRYKDSVKMENPVVESAIDEQVNGTIELIATNRMSCIVNTINTDNHEEKTRVCNVPVELLGKTKDEIIAYLKNWRGDRIKDKGELISKVELVSMKSDRIVLKKYVRLEEETTMSEITRFFVTLKDDKLVVYESDRKTMFLETNINICILDTDSINRLKKGIEVRNISEMYRILESFTT